MSWRIRHSRPSGEHATVPLGFPRRVSSMAQELVLRSNSSFLCKESTCAVTRRTFVGHHHGNARPAVIVRPTESLEPDQRRRSLPVVVADVDADADFRAGGAGSCQA